MINYFLRVSYGGALLFNKVDGGALLLNKASAEALT